MLSMSLGTLISVESAIISCPRRGSSSEEQPKSASTHVLVQTPRRLVPVNMKGLLGALGSEGNLNPARPPVACCLQPQLFTPRLTAGIPVDEARRLRVPEGCRTARS